MCRQHKALEINTSNKQNHQNSDTNQTRNIFGYSWCSVVLLSPQKMKQNENKEQKIQSQTRRKNTFLSSFFSSWQRCSNHSGVVHMIFKTGLMVFTNACVYALVRVFLTLLTHSHLKTDWTGLNGKHKNKTKPKFKCTIFACW